MATSALPETFSPPLKRKLIAWLPTLAWVAMIALFSTDSFSANQTGSILLRLLRAIHINLSAHQFYIIHFLVRKGAHFTVYGILSGFAFFSWRLTVPRPVRWALIWNILALVLTLVVASSDEFHQSFIPSRGPSVFDVLLDMCGAVFVQILIAAFARSKR